MKEKPSVNDRPLLYVIGLCVVFIISFSYIFNSKIDLNGDNCVYYNLASSIAGGHGYADNVSGAGYSATNVFPPGYPLLMSAVRVFTESFFAQKVLNGLFLLASIVLLFFFVRKSKLPVSLAFIAAAAAALNYRVLHFATMMMSETSFLLLSVATLWALINMDDRKAFWKDRNFYLSILFASYCFHIRTQGIALIVGVVLYFLFNKRWKETAGFALGFAVSVMPWIIRNKILNLGQSRYLEMVGQANSWRPEEGMLGAGEIVSRFFDTLQMLVAKALPNSIIPYMSANYGNPTTAFEWLAGILLLAIMAIGMWQFGRFKYLFLFYTAATFGVISLFSTPGENRYLTSLLPLFELCLIIGLYAIISFAAKRLNLTAKLTPWVLVVSLLFAFPMLKDLHTQNKAQFPPNYQNFFNIAESVRKNLPAETVICTRKGELFRMYSKGFTVGYAYTQDDKALIQGLVDAKADYVVLEQLGYSSTGLYLYPAIQKNSELFDLAMHLPNPDTYLLKFNIAKAKAKLAEK